MMLSVVVPFIIFFYVSSKTAGQIGSGYFLGKIGAVANAEQSAKVGNGPKTLKSLKSAGKWAPGFAEKIGVGVATAALKSALGI